MYWAIWHGSLKNVFSVIGGYVLEILRLVGSVILSLKPLILFCVKNGAMTILSTRWRNTLTQPSHRPYTCTGVIVGLTTTVTMAWVKNFWDDTGVYARASGSIVWACILSQISGLGSLTSRRAISTVPHVGFSSLSCGARWMCHHVANLSGFPKLILLLLVL